VTDQDLALVDAALPLIAEATGVDFRGYRLPMVSRRLRNHMLALGVAEHAEYVERLRRSADMRTAALERITIKVSRFFRNPAAFDRLAECLGNAHGTAHASADVWIAGCGTGEEVWSIAMLLRQAAIDARILATDIDANAMATAARGRYASSVMNDVPSALRGYLEPATNGQVTVHAELRRMVEFRRHDLTCDAPPVRDALLASCRNVLIYFQRPYQTLAQTSLVQALSPGGLLFLGEAEWLTPDSLGVVQVVSAVHRVFQRSPLPAPRQS
jgi:chemotaxis protein methyltransferase CheR